MNDARTGRTTVLEESQSLHRNAQECNRITLAFLSRLSQRLAMRPCSLQNLPETVLTQLV